MNLDNIAAIVVAYNHGDSLRPTLDALERSAVGQVIVWDNSPSSGEAFVGESTGRLTVAGDGTNRGFGGGNNAAMSLLEPEIEFVVFVNPDCIVDASTLTSLRDRFSEQTGVGAVAPRMLYPDGSYGIAGGPAPSIVKELISILGPDRLLPRRIRRLVAPVVSKWVAPSGESSLLDTTREGVPIDVSWASGFCLMMEKTVAAELGPFDEDYFLYFEDVDLCKRTRDSGRRVLIDRQVDALHFESTSTGPGKSDHYKKGLATYIGKHGTDSDKRMVRFLAAAK